MSKKICKNKHPFIYWKYEETSKWFGILKKHDDYIDISQITSVLRVCLPGGGGPQIGEVIYGGSPHLSCKRDEIEMRDYMDRRVTQTKRVTSPTWGPQPPCKQALKTYKWQLLDSNLLNKTDDNEFVIMLNVNQQNMV